jgi:uncharacterized RDD family membrane protein YckC
VNAQAGRPAGLWRRLAALLYDGLLLAAVLFLGTLVLLPMSGGEAITPQQSGAWEYAYRAWILLLVAGFFGVSWTARGQTLGMMSWKIRLEREGGGLPGWRRALLRLGLGAIPVLAALVSLLAPALGERAPPGAWRLMLLLPALANYLWVAIDPEAGTLLDRLTGCRVLRTG